MAPKFEKDERVAKMVAAYALDAVDAAQGNFKTTLDWSENSVTVVEGLLAKLHDSIPSQKPPDDVVWSFAKMFGSYVGEVFRKNHGGEWGFIDDGQQKFPGIQWRGNTLFWPWGRVHQRLLKGPAENVADYYRIMAAG
jgi:hypothetical protein